MIPSLRIIWMSATPASGSFEWREQERDQVFLSKPVPVVLLRCFVFECCRRSPADRGSRTS